MGIRQEFDTLKLQIKADEKILRSATSHTQEAKGPLGFIEYFMVRRYYSVKLGAILSGSISYLYERLVIGDSPEEIATRNQSLIKIFNEPV